MPTVSEPTAKAVMSYGSATEPEFATFTNLPVEIKEMIYENAIYGEKYFNKNSLGLLDACSTDRNKYCIVSQVTVRDAPLSLLLTQPTDATDILRTLIRIADNDKGRGFAIVKTVAIAYGESYGTPASKQNIAIIQHCQNLRTLTVQIPMLELPVTIPPTIQQNLRLPHQRQT